MWATATDAYLYAMKLDMAEDGGGMTETIQVFDWEGNLQNSYCPQGCFLINFWVNNDSIFGITMEGELLKFRI